MEEDGIGLGTTYRGTALGGFGEGDRGDEGKGADEGGGGSLGGALLLTKVQVSKSSGPMSSDYLMTQHM